MTTTYDEEGTHRSTDVPDHPAKFSRKHLELLRRMLAEERDRVGHVKVLDPFAGAGGIHDLAEQAVETYGVELQPEWAAAHERTITGSVLELPSIFPAGTFDVLATSPCYGNRMADAHAALDPCRRCGEHVCWHCGKRVRMEEGQTGGYVVHVIDGMQSSAEGGMVHLAEQADQTYDGEESRWATARCKSCRGTAKSRRNTYTHYLRAAGAEPVDSDDNAVLMQWGPRYREFHEAAWAAAHHVLRPDGLVLLNVKNHWRDHILRRVTEFHLNAFLTMGYTLEEARQVRTKGLAEGANHDAREPFELIIALRRPA